MTQGSGTLGFGRGWFVYAGLALVGTSLLAACNGLLGIGPAAAETEGPTDATTAADAPAVADAGPPALTCSYYCSTIMNNCTDSNAEYLSNDICMSMCPAFELGTAIQDTQDDTLGCRIFEATAAASNPDQACRYAGPLGGGHCGKVPCTSFCNVDVGYCTAPKPAAYTSGTDCITSCARYPYLTVDAGDTTTESGDSLNCRLWHLETAYTSESYGVFHCPHTARVSTFCFDPDAGMPASDGGHD